jgi:hypothetical protein
MKNIIIICVVILLTVISGGLFYCCSFDPVGDIDSLPPECQTALNIAKLYSKAEDKSAVVKPFEYCYKCLHRIRCQAEVFGVDEKGNPNPIDYTQQGKYRDYNECLKELQ